MRRPFVYIFFSLFLGISLTYFFNIGLTTKPAIIIIIALVIMLILTENQEKILFLVLFFVLGNFLFTHRANYDSMLKEIDFNRPIDVLIQNEGIEKGSFRRYIEYEALVLLTKEKSLIRVYDQEEDFFNVGDIVNLKNYRLVYIDTDNQNLKGYSLYLKSQGIKNIIDVNRDYINYLESEDKSLRTVSARTRRYIENYFDASFQLKERNLLKSIMFGNRGYMSGEMIEHFSRSGTAHIIAVSGLHIGLIILFLQRGLRFTNIRKKYLKIITMLILLIYAFAVNFPVSILRASIMYYLYVAAYFLERKYDPINSLMLIGTILLIINPFIIFSVSFQLSFCATLGILIFYPIISSKLEGNVPKAISPLLAVTLSAQIATVPIIVFHFNYLSIISIVANLLIVPVMGLLISLTLCSVILGLVSVSLALPLNFTINILLQYINKTAEITSKSFASGINIEFVELYHVLLYYIIIITIYCVKKYKQTLEQLSLEE